MATKKTPTAKRERPAEASSTVKQTFVFPELGVSVEAHNLLEAEELAQEKVKEQ